MRLFSTVRCRAYGRDKESVFRLDIPLLCDKIRNDKTEKVHSKEVFPEFHTGVVSLKEQ